MTEEIPIEDDIINIWTHISLSYTSNSFKLFINSQLKATKDIDLKSVFKNADGFILFDNFNGIFTEI